MFPVWKLDADWPWSKHCARIRCVFHSAWPGYNALLPARNKLWASCVSHVILIKGVPGVKTWCRLAMKQTWCQNTLRFSLSKPLLNTNFSTDWNCHPGFQWLLFVFIETSCDHKQRRHCSAPCFFVTVPLTHITTVLFAAGSKTAFHPFMNCVQLWDGCNPAERILKFFPLSVFLLFIVRLTVCLLYLHKIQLDNVEGILIQIDICE